MGGYEIISVLIVVALVPAIAFLVSLVMREVMCWYWKINEAVYLLRSIDEKLGNRGSLLIEIVLCRPPSDISHHPSTLPRAFRHAATRTGGGVLNSAPWRTVTLPPPGWSQDCSMGPTPKWLPVRTTNSRSGTCWNWSIHTCSRTFSGWKDSVTPTS